MANGPMELIPVPSALLSRRLLTHPPRQKQAGIPHRGRSAKQKRLACPHSASVKNIFTGFLIIATTILAEARISKYWSDQEIYDKADLVVIARPVSTQETNEQTVLPDIAPHVQVIGLSTIFDVRAVMKGDRDLKSLILHHYRLV